MRIVIIGAGEVGFHIASELEREGHDLVIIEQNEARVSELQTRLDVLAVTGDGCDPTILQQNGVGSADLLFAVSNNDPANMLAALTARRLGVGRCVARLGSDHHGENPLITEDPGIVPLYPERLVAEEIFGLTRVPGASRAHFFADGRLVLLAARPSRKAAIYKKPLKELEGPEGWILSGIRRTDGMVIPRGDSVLRKGDLLYAVGRTESVPEYLASIGVESQPTRRVVIAGGGQVGYWLSKLLVGREVAVTIIQRSEQRAFDLAAEIPGALVLRGDATDPAVLREARVGDADYFVASTQDDEANILSSLLARELGCRNDVALYHRPEFANVLQAVRIDLPISPRLMVAGHILKMVHGREVLGMDLVAGGVAEVVEFEVRPRARALKGALIELDFPRSAIASAIIRGDELHMPGGDFRFQVGDRVLVFTLTDSLAALEKLFRER